MERIELSNHTTMSRMDGVVTPRELVKFAWKQGCHAVAITDYNTIQGFPEAAQAVESLCTRFDQEDAPTDFKVIYGIETTLTDDDHSLIHLLARDQAGLEALYRLAEQIDCNCTISKQDVTQFRGSLLVGCPAECGELYYAILDNTGADHLSNLAEFYDYLEVLPPECYGLLPSKERFPHNNIFEMEDIIKAIYSIGKDKGIPVVAVGNTRFLTPEESDAYSVLRCEKCQPLHFRSTDEMLRTFAFLGEDAATEIVTSAPYQLAELCGKVEILSDKPLFPVIPEAHHTLRSLCWDRLHELYGEQIPQVCEKRFMKELARFRRLKNAGSIFLIVRHLVLTLKKKGYLIGSRGCVAASYVAYLLEITDIDPITFNLPWETLFGLDYDITPDIDLNVSGDYWDAAMEALAEVFPYEALLQIGSIEAIPYHDATKMICEYQSRNGLEWSEEEIDQISERLTNVKRSFNTRPGCIVIAPDVTTRSQFIPASQGRILYEYHYFEDNLLKLDILSGDTWSLLSTMEKLTGISSASIDLEASISLLLADPENIPEFGSPALREMLEIAKPATMDEIIRLNALAHSTGGWEDNAKTLIVDGIATIGEVIGSRDDVFYRLLSTGLDWFLSFEIMESVRKGKKLRDEWVPIMLNAGIPHWFVNSCNKISYLFPKAHATSYTTAALKAAWFKANYPKEYAQAYSKLI